MRNLRATSILVNLATVVLLFVPFSTRADDEDPFLWLEAIEGPEAREWIAERNDEALDALTEHPAYADLYDNAMAILTSEARIPYGSLRNDYVYNFWRDADHVRGLWRRASLSSYRAAAPEWETLLDLDHLAETEDENWVWKGASCLPPQYLRCLVRLSRGGKDAAVYREFDVARSAFVTDGFVVPEAKSSATWKDADTLLIGTDWGEGSMTESGYPRTVKRWQRGTPLAEADLFFAGDEADVLVSAAVLHSPDVPITLVVRAVTFFETEYFVEHEGELVRLPIPPRSDVEGVFQGKIIVSLQEDWTYAGKTFTAGSLVSYQPSSQHAESVYVPTAGEAVRGVAITRSALLLQTLDNVVGKVRKLEPTAGGWNVSDVDLPGIGTVSLAASNPFRDDFMLNFDAPVTPDTLYYVSAAGEVQAIQALPAFFDAAGIVVQQRFATSTDGTRIPYFLIGRESVLESGPAPTHLTAYGGFQISRLATYSATVGKLWLERGGIYVLANIRGGGEYGPAWHQAALKQNRQVAFDDFFAVAEDLIETGVTTPRQLGISGGSNGGLLMGVAMTQRPDLFNAITILVPLLDMLRYDKLLAGASWVAEYGDPDIEAERAYLQRYSPYHNLDAEADYPLPFIYTSTKDDRVHPGHARKMAAKMLQQGHELIYYENTEGGHAGAANHEQSARRLAMMYAYFTDRLMAERSADTTE